MAEYTSRRRQQMGADEFDKDMQEIERAAEKGAEIERKKQEKREKLEKDPAYVACAKISKVMDKYMLDPILGLIPGVGDFVTQVLTLPFIYVAATKIKSLPLTLAIIFNTLTDMLVGAIPLLGDLIDFFHRSHNKNYRLLSGFIEDDKEIKHEVNKKAIFCAIGIAILIYLIYLVMTLVAQFMGHIWDSAGELIGNIWGYFTALFQ